MKRKNDSGTASIQAGTISSFFKITIIALGMLSFSMVAAFAADTGENTENKKLEAMISELEQKIEAADKRMVAHPSFIQELRELAGRYRAQLRHLFFRDTFKDGNYDQDPKWIVKSGAFQATPEGWLSSTLALPEEAPQSGTGSEQKISTGAEAVGILLDNIFGLPEKKSTAQEDPEPLAEPVQPASIYTKSIFSPAFEMQIEFQSEPGSRFDITLLGSESLVPRYRLKIVADHSPETPIEVIRTAGSRSFTVGASDQFPVINDGKFHTLSWIRFSDGAMHVRIDDIKVLQTYEVYYRDSFTGFEITNNGGSHKWDSVTIFKALPPAAN